MPQESQDKSRKEFRASLALPMTCLTTGLVLLLAMVETGLWQKPLGQCQDLIAGGGGPPTNRISARGSTPETPHFVIGIWVVWGSCHLKETWFQVGEKESAVPCIVWKFRLVLVP
jgi:hypothetical protein